MALVLEIEFLMGVCFAARSRNETEPDWPPQPDRVFSALTASWCGQGDRGRAALTWLEAQALPRLEASDAKARPAPETYVPPNDVTTLPEARRRQPRRFPAALPEVPLMRMVWDAEPPGEILATLEHLAHDTACIGHSASLTRCRFLIEGDPSPATAEAPAAGRIAGLKVQPPRRRISAGRLVTLERAYAAGRRPPPATPVPLPPDRDTDTGTPASHFGRQWHVLAAPEDDLPAMTAFAPVALALRRALMSTFDGAEVPAVISGHTPEGSPLEQPHLAIVPLANVGYEHSDGSLKGIALVLPRWVEEGLRVEGFDARAYTLNGQLRAALARLLRSHSADEERQITLHLSAHRAVHLVLSEGDASLASLRPARWCAKGRCWASATPVLLNRHLKGDGAARAAEMEAQIADSCTHIGLPRPHQVVTCKHPAVTGAPSAWRSARGQPWADWTLPEKYRSRWRTHVVIDFGQTVRGPVLLGAARHLGLGLCLPLDTHGATP